MSFWSKVSFESQISGERFQDPLSSGGFILDVTVMHLFVHDDLLEIQQ